jgi:hypothetical protein
VSEDRSLCIFSVDTRIFTRGNISAFAIWNTRAGEDSQPSTPGLQIGQYWPAHRPFFAFDDNSSTYLCNYGHCNFSFYGSSCGANTGVYLTLPRSPFILNSFQFISTHQSYSRDPKTLTIEGSNRVGLALTLGSSWTLIYNGSAGFDIDMGRKHPGTLQTLVANQQAFSSYRFLFTAKQGSESCLEFSDIYMFADT